MRLRVGLALLALASLFGATCLPVDTRTPPASIFLMVTSADEPLVTTADGWSIVVDRLMLGIGGAALGIPNAAAFDYRACSSYSEPRGYFRLLDARLPTDQKLSTLFGLGRCNFIFSITWPPDDALLGENVTQADKDRMVVRELDDGRRTEGIAIEFSATATRGPETKQVHWRFREGPRALVCGRAVAGMPSQPFELESEANLAFHIGIRGAALFADDASPNASLRFDSIAAADTLYGDADGEITLDEVGKVTLNVARRHGPYNAASVPGAPVGPALPGSLSLEDYIYLALLPTIVRMREDVTCTALPNYGPPRRPIDASADDGEASVDDGGREE